MTRDKTMSPNEAPNAFDQFDYAFVQAKMEEAHRMRSEAIRSGFKAFLGLFRSPERAETKAPQAGIAARPVEG